MDSSSHVCEKIGINKKWENLTEVVILALLMWVVVYRVVCSVSEPEKYGGLGWTVAFLCECWFAFEHVLAMVTTWTPVEFRTRPEAVLAKKGVGLPAVDVFVTTADPQLEPVMVTVNTVLSLMAVDYPADKLACYVSDDACSPLLLYSLIEASRFARLWIPFCKNHSLQLRAPFKYFASDCCGHNPLLWRNIKDEYEGLTQRVEEAAKGGVLQFDTGGEFGAFADTDKRDHPSIVKVILENKEGDPEGLPHLIYVCREKRPNSPHHYKAGAMNVLTRVSGLMTNAPYMLNVDCDMFANNPRVVLKAMCSFLGLKPQDSAFVQFPQVFYNNLKDDPFGTQLAVGFEIIGRGMAGIQGPPYAGTGCFHRRKLIYGFSLDVERKMPSSEEELKELFGSCEEFVGSVLRGHIRPKHLSISNVVQASTDIARCHYELGTAWGTKVGWGYGSLTEDLLTGIRIHSKGWRSVSLMPDPPGFLGLAPISGPTSLVQRKRWVTGMLQILVGPSNPILATIKANLHFRQSLAYTWIFSWGLRSIPDMCYAALPPYSIITSSPFLPKAREPAMAVFAAQFLIHHLCTLYIYLKCGQSVRSWCNNLRIAKIVSATCNLFGVLSFVVQLLGISDIGFEVTQKDQAESVDDNANNNAGRFSFDESPMFVPGTTLVLVHLTALSMSLFWRRSIEMEEFLSSVWVVICFWPFVRGLFGKGIYGIPWSTILKSAAFTFLFVQLSTHHPLTP